MEGASTTFYSSTSPNYYPAALRFPKAAYIFVCVFSVITALASILRNIVILLALRTCQSVHSASKALLSSLALTGLFVGVVDLPLFVTRNIIIILQIPQHHCDVAITYKRISTFIGAVSLENVVTIAVDRYLALRLHLRYRQVVKLGRVLFILVLEWVTAAIFYGSWFLNGPISLLSGVFALFSYNFFVVALCYVSMYRSIRRHVAQVHNQTNSTRPESDFIVVQYRKTVNNSLWIFGVFVLCYTPSRSMPLAL